MGQVPQWWDLSVPLESAMSRSFAYPAPVFDPTQIGTQPNGHPVTAMRIEMFSHVGTHIESARHVFGDGPTLDDFPLDRFTGPAVVLDLSAHEELCVDESALEAAVRQAGQEEHLEDAFLLLSMRREEDDVSGTADHGYLSEGAARWLVERRLRALGVDCPTPDMAVHRRSHRLDLPVHRVLLSAGMLVIENLNPRLREVAGRRGDLQAWPLSITGSDSSPVRVVLALPPEEEALPASPGTAAGVEQ